MLLTQILRDLMFEAVIVKLVTTWKNEKWSRHQ